MRVAIRIENGVEEHCWVHIADFVNDGLRPYSWYKRFILEGARAHGLPQDYIASLEVIEAAEDDDRDRDLRWRAMSCDLK